MNRTVVAVAVVFVSILGLAAVVPAADEAKPMKLIAVMKPTKDSKVRGTVIFSEMEGKVHVTANITGLEPGSKHAIHVHEFGDGRGDDGNAAGGHYNPEGHQHGLPDVASRHAGDLGNLTADDKGAAKYEIMVDNITLTGKNAVIGRGVVIHAKVDDGGQPVGNAGDRIAVGVIGVMNTEWKAAPKAEKK